MQLCKCKKKWPCQNKIALYASLLILPSAIVRKKAFFTALHQRSAKIVPDTAPSKSLICSRRQWEEPGSSWDLTPLRAQNAHKSVVMKTGAQSMHTSVALAAGTADMFVTGLLDCVSCSVDTAALREVHIFVFVFFLLEKTVCILSIFWALNHTWRRKLCTGTRRCNPSPMYLGVQCTMYNVQCTMDLLCHSSCDPEEGTAAFMLLSWSMNAKKRRMGGCKYSPVPKSMDPSIHSPACQQRTTKKHTSKKLGYPVPALSPSLDAMFSTETELNLALCLLSFPSTASIGP